MIISAITHPRPRQMLAAETAENEIKIRINTIAPGVFLSEMATGDSHEYHKSHVSSEKYAQKVAVQRPGHDINMAQAAPLVAADQYING